MLNIIIPLAGLGSRFSEAKYTYPKPLLDINGQAMIAKVVENLKPSGIYSPENTKFIFIVQEEHTKKYDLENVLKFAAGEFKYEIIKIDGITKGAACTVLRAIDFIDNEDELMIANSDQLIVGEEMGLWYRNLKLAYKENEMEGCIMVFKANHPKWSYVLEDEKGIVLEVAEKKIISNFATTGVYWFQKGRDFVNGAKDMMKKDIRTNNEFYVCPVYNELILNSKMIRTYEIEAKSMVGLGDPESYERYLTTSNG